MKTILAVSTTLFVFAFGYGITALAAADDARGPAPLAKQLSPARGGARLSVTSTAFLSGGDIDERFTQNGENRSPPLAWTKGPSGTVSYAVIAEDANTDGPTPTVHWVLYDIPGTMTRLPENQPKDAALSMGALQGRNAANDVGFLGPKPPAGATHTYHIQVFALRSRLRLDPAETDRDDVLKAMKGNVLAIGDLVGTYTGK